MANRFARKTGNWDASDVWSDTPTGIAGAQFIPTVGDVAMANSFVVTINVNATCLEIRNDTTGGATTGGSFTLPNGITLTANLFAGATAVLLNYSGNVSIIGNITAGTAGYIHGSATVTANSVLNVTGNVTGGVGSSAYGIGNISTSAINVTGNVTGGVGSSAVGILYGSTVNVTGNVTGGAGANASGIQSVSNLTVTGNVTGNSYMGIYSTGPGSNVITGNVTGGNLSALYIQSTASYNITGNVTGGTGTNSFGAQLDGSGPFTLNGNAYGGNTTAGCFGIRKYYATIQLIVNGNVYGGAASTSYGISSNDGGPVTVVGDVIGGTGPNAFGYYGQLGALNILGHVISNNYPNDGIVNATPGIYLTGTGTAKIGGMKTGTGGLNPIDGAIASRRVFFAPGGVQAAFLYDANQGSLVSLSNVDADHPDVTDVRSGVSYYQGSRTGTCIIPPVAAVGVGVPVDHTVGQAALTQADIAAVVGPIWSAS